MREYSWTLWRSHSEMDDRIVDVKRLKSAFYGMKLGGTA